MLQVTRCEGFYCCCYCSLWCSCSYYFYYDHHHSYSNHSLVTKLENCFEKSAFYFKIQRKLAGYKCWLQMFRAWMANVRYKICGHSLSIHTLHNRFCDLLDRPTPPPLHTYTPHHYAPSWNVSKKNVQHHDPTMLKLLHTSRTNNVKQLAFSICTTSLKSKWGQIPWCQAFSHCNATWTVLLQLQIY